MNPWLLAGLVFGVIGLIQEAMTASDDPKKSKVVKPDKPKELSHKAGDTIVNVGGQTVQTPAQKAAAKKKEDEKKPKIEPASDG